MSNNEVDGHSYDDDDGMMGEEYLHVNGKVESVEDDHSKSSIRDEETEEARAQK